MNPLVTVIIPFYNCPFIDHAVASALEQTYDNLEVLVVDDGSTVYTERLAPYMNRIHYLGKANGGTASALNHAIRYASGDYVAWLSSDDRMYSNKIERQLCFMLEQQAYISHTNFDFINAANQVIHGSAGVVFPTQQSFIHSFLSMNPVNGCTVMAKKELFQAVGLFQESLRFTQDMDMWCRVILSGYPFPYLNESLTGYRVHEGMGTNKYKPEVELEVSQTLARYAGAFQQMLASMGG